MRGRASGRMGPLCTWWGWLWGPDLGTQEESREEEKRGQKLRREARGLKGLMGDMGDMYRVLTVHQLHAKACIISLNPHNTFPRQSL